LILLGRLIRERIGVRGTYRKVDRQVVRYCPVLYCKKGMRALD
jgi:hypothetical protein